MALVTRPHPAAGRLKGYRALVAMASCMALGACAQGNKSATEMLSLNAKPEAASEQAASQAAPQPVDHTAELREATEYWGKEFSKKPKELQPALNFARNLKALGDKQRALAVLQQAAMFHADSRELANEYGRLALDLDQVGLADRLLAIADDPVKPDWRVVSARGTVLAKQGKYAEAIPFYERALSLAQDQPSVLSNLALAHAMNGEPARAETMLRQAAATDRNSLKIRQNLALVLGLQGKYAEAKLLASHDLSPENAAENTEYLRRVVRLEPNAPPSDKAAPQLAQSREVESEPAAPLPQEITSAIESKPAHAEVPAVGEAKHPVAVPATAKKAARPPLVISFSEPSEEDTQLSMNFAQNLPLNERRPAPAPAKSAITLAPSVR